MKQPAYTITMSIWGFLLLVWVSALVVFDATYLFFLTGIFIIIPVACTMSFLVGKGNAIAQAARADITAHQQPLLLAHRGPLPQMSAPRVAHPVDGKGVLLPLPQDDATVMPLTPANPHRQE